MIYIKRTTLIKDLKLPGTYRVMTSVTGHIDKTHYYLVRMGSPTLGTETVYAKSVSFAKWEEIKGDEFMNLAQQVLNGA